MPEARLVLTYGLVCAGIGYLMILTAWLGFVLQGMRRE